MKNYVGISRDHSISMQHIALAAMRDYNETIEGIRESAQGIDTIVSAVMCGGDELARVVRDYVNSSIHVLKPLTSYPTPGRRTPLYDSIMELIKIKKSLPDINDPEVTVLINVITDGKNNSSRTSASELRREIQKLQDTDRWTFIFRVPRGEKVRIVRDLGVYPGNVEEWDPTSSGIKKSTKSINRGISSYYDNIRTGRATSSRRLFADTSRVTSRSLKKLEELSDQFVMWRTNTIADGASIRGFVNARLKKDGYKKGYAHYELVKPEKVQSYKKILIMDKKTRNIYGGPQARQLLGIPDGDCRLNPGDHNKYVIFVQSTSVNRKLPPRTRVLYLKK